jgi:hypothetical protein
LVIGDLSGSGLVLATRPYPAIADDHPSATPPPGTRPFRGAAVTILSEAGCTPQGIATITGYTVASVHKILEVYLARTRALAQSAIIKLDGHQRNAK